jgi:hypothetical protein
MENVYESFEKMTIFMKKFPKWTHWTDENLNKCLELYETGYLYVLSERDNEGRRIIMCNNIVDSNRFDADDVSRLFNLISASLQFEEETQIAGIVFIGEFSKNISMSYFTMFPLKSIYEQISAIRHAPLRVKKIYLIGLPSFATQIINFIKRHLSDKIRKRVFIENNISDAAEIVDKSLLPLEYGGKIPRSEMIQNYKKNLLFTVDKINATLKKYDIDWAKVECKEQQVSESVGSFRKLEID